MEDLSRIAFLQFLNTYKLCLAHNHVFTTLQSLLCHVQYTEYIVNKKLSHKTPGHTVQVMKHTGPCHARTRFRLPSWGHHQGVCSRTMPFPARSHLGLCISPLLLLENKTEQNWARTELKQTTSVLPGTAESTYYVPVVNFFMAGNGFERKGSNTESLALLRKPNIATASFFTREMKERVN